MQNPEYQTPKLILDDPLHLCGHNARLKVVGKNKLLCPECKSFWDVDALESEVLYDRTYPELRSHFDPDVGKCKVKTLKYWLKKSGIDLTNLNVCEVGFGGGFSLQFLNSASSHVFGIEVVQENIAAAIRLGVNGDSLFLADSLPDRLPNVVDLWIFQDSFEHIPDPSGFVAWLIYNSSEHSKILLVAPDATSLSETIMGRLWPHRLPDHPFHWSQKGLISFLSKNGFKLEKSFYPLKYVSMKSIISHILYKTGKLHHLNNRLSSKKLNNIKLIFNIGEMGLVFRREGNG